MDFQVGGTSQFKVGLNGVITGGSSSTLSLGNQTVGGNTLALSGVALINGLLNITGNGNIVISSPSVAVTHFGNVDAASPVAQTLGVQGVVAGNGNTAGANWTLQGSLSNGSGGGDILIKTTLSTAASGTQNTGATALMLKGGTQNAVFSSLFVSAGYTVSTLPAGTTGARAHVTDATSPTFLGTLTGSGSTVCPVFYNGSAWLAG
jgi:hypothetical protein